MKTKKYTTTNRVTFISSCVLLSLFLLSVSFQTQGIVGWNDQGITTDNSTIPLSQAAPDTSDIVKLSNEVVNDLGEVEIINLILRGDPNYYPVDILEENISIIQTSPVFIGTTKPATIDRMVDSISYVTVQINETVTWEYYDTCNEYQVGFYPYLQPATLNSMYLNGTELEESKYTSNYSVGEASWGFYYDFEENFDNFANGTLMLTYLYEADIPVSAWACRSSGPDQYITEETQEVTQDFEYQLTFGKTNINLDIGVRFNVTLPAANEIFNVEFGDFENNLTLESQVDKFENNEIQFYNINLTSPKGFDLTFQANFTVEILDSIEGFWTADRLVSGMYVRERDYKITVSEGPEKLFCNFLWLNDTTINHDNVDTTKPITSALGRGCVVVNMNTSADEGASPVDEETTETQSGISILGYQAISADIYSLLPGEVDVVTVRYNAIDTLNLVVMDKITTPLEGYRVNVYMGDTLYGPKVAMHDAQPHPIKQTNENGQTQFLFVPEGNYTVEIFNPQGEFIANKTASTTSTINFLVTEVPHFPTTILIYTGISIAFILIGAVIYKKNQD